MFAGTYFFGIWLHFANTSLTMSSNSSLQLKFQFVPAILSVSLNVMLTILLVGRLLWLDHRYRRAFGKSKKTYTYTSPAAMIVESAALYTIPMLIQSIMFFVSQASLDCAIPAALANITVVSPSGIVMIINAYCIVSIRPSHRY
jgi:hypothetical protein